MIAKASGPVAFAFTQSGFLLPATLAVSMPKIIADDGGANSTVDQETLSANSEGDAGEGDADLDDGAAHDVRAPRPVDLDLHLGRVGVVVAVGVGGVAHDRLAV